MQTVAAAVGLLCLVLWIRVFRSGVLKRELFNRPVIKPVSWGLLDVYLIFAIVYFLVPLAVLAIFQPAPNLALKPAVAQVSNAGTAVEIGVESTVHVPTQDELTQRQWIAGGSRLIAILVSIAWLFLRHRVSFDELGLGLRRPGRQLLLGVVGAVMLIPPVMLLHVVLMNLIQYQHPTINDMLSGFSLEMFAAAVFSAGLVAPLTEEFLFRGVIQGFLQRWFSQSNISVSHLLTGSISHQNAIGESDSVAGDNGQNSFSTVPIFISAGIFAALHLGQGAAAVPLFFLAVGLGYLYWRTGSLIPSIVIHVILNVWSLTFVAVQSAS